jgi:hypothetical protein
MDGIVARCRVALIVSLTLAAAWLAVARSAGVVAQGPRVLDASRPIGYFVATGDTRDSYRTGDSQLAQWALESWQRTIGSMLKLSAVAEPSALVRVYWGSARGGQYGEMRSLQVGDQIGAAVFIRPDMDALGPDIAALAGQDPLLRETIVYLTCVHELGHAFGLEHTADFRDIMYSFQYGGDIVEYFDRYRRKLKTRDDIAHVSAMSDGDIVRARTLYPAR